MFEQCLENEFEEDKIEEEKRNQEREQKIEERKKSKADRELARKKRREEREKRKAVIAKDSQNEKPFQAPMPYLMSWIFSFLGGVQMTIKRIHIRYEDDFFNHHRPFSLGFTLDRLNFGNAGSHWTF